jgi:hypothetical protein
MEPSVQTLIGALPPYRDEWVVIHPNQEVHDIIREVLDAHCEFAPLYDDIALYFDAGTIDEICDKLFTFCKKNLKYREESETEQTTSVPQGLLSRGYCDCKGYASFCCGVLDGIGRLTGKKIDWAYRFASYNPLVTVPHHVFTVVTDKGEELWIDPTPNSDKMQPVWQTNKKISGMPLIRNIAGLEGVGAGRSVGIASLAVTPYIHAGETQLNFQGPESNILAGMWPNYMGLSDYRDYSGDRDINEWNVAAQINNLVAQAGGTHTVPGDFVKWVYDNSIRSWNFFYPNGVQPGFDGSTWLLKWQHGLGLSGWPTWVVTQDGRVTIDHDVQVDDYRNAGIHILTAWAQDLIDKYDGAPYPLKPAAVKEFTQNYTGNPGNPNANILHEARGSSFFQDVGKTINAAINDVKNAVITVVGIIPRNAFLALVGLNVFHIATDLADNINSGHWDEISSIWKKLGGNADKLRNTIEHGAGQTAIEDETVSVDPATVTGATVGVVQVAAIVAAATPVLMALLQFLNKDGKLNGAVIATESALQAAYPGADFSVLNGALTSGGQPTTFQTTPQYDENSPLFGSSIGNLNPVVVGVGAGGISYLLFKRQPRNKRILFAGGIGVLAWYLWKKRQQQQQAALLLKQPAATSYSTSNFQNLLTSLETGLAAYQEQQALDSGTTQYADTSIDYNLYSDLSQQQTTV